MNTLNTKTSLAILLGLLLCLPTALEAESQQTDENNVELSLDQVRAHAILNGLEAKKIDANFASLLAQALEVRLLQNPSISTQVHIPYSYDGSRPRTEVEVALEHPIRISDFGLRSKVSDLISGVAEQRKQLEVLELMQRISLSYYRLWALRQERIHIQDRRKRATRIERVISDSVAQGQSTLAEVKVSKANEAESRADLMGIEHQISAEERKLLRLATLDVAGKKLTPPEVSALRPFNEVYEAARENKNSLGDRTSLQKKLAREQLALAKRDKFPTLTPLLSYARNDDGNDFIGVGISFPLPFYNRNQAEIKKQRTELSYRQRESQYIQGEEFHKEFKALYDGVANKLKQAQLFDREVLPLLRQSVTISEEAFKNAQLSLFELWSIQNKFHEAFDRSIALRVEAFAALTELSLLTGELEI